MPCKGRRTWLVGLPALLLLGVGPQTGLAEKGKGVVDLGRPHFSPAERPALEDIPDRGIGRHFRLVDHNPLVNPGQALPRGGNGIELGVVRDCLYVPSRLNTQGTLIVDISKPHRTVVRGSIAPTPSPPEIGTRTLSTEILSAIESENLLVRQYRSMPPPGPAPDKGIELFDTTDCFNPVLASTITLPDGRHENFLWQGGNPHRVLLFVSFSSGGPGAPRRRDTSPFPAPPYDVDIRVYDVTDKYHPVGPVATWSLQRFGIPTIELADLLTNANQPQRNSTHTMTVSADGTRVYVSQSYAGFFLLDSTALAVGAPCDVEPGRIEDATPANPFGVNPNACLKKLHTDPNVRLDHHPPFGQTTTHSAYKVPGRPYVVLNDEHVGNDCPGGWLRIVFVDGETDVTLDPLIPGVGTLTTRYRADLFPAVVGSFMVPENIIERCPETMARLPDAHFKPHKSLVFRNLVFTSYMSGGARAIDISNPGVPFEAGFFFTKPVRRTQDGTVNPEIDLQNHPVLKDGLLYFLDVDSGLYILKYTGPRNEEIPGEGLFTPNAIQVPGREP